MESFFRPPEPLVLDGNIADSLKKVAVLLNLIGDDGLELFNSFTFPPGDEKKLE